MNATITRIEDKQGIQTVNLEWNGPDDHTIEDFALDQLGERCKGIGGATGGNLRSGWVVLEGECKLSEGDSIPLLTKTVLVLETTPYGTRYELAECQHDDTGYNVNETGSIQSLEHLENLQEQANEVYETQSLSIKSRMNRIK